MSNTVVIIDGTEYTILKSSDVIEAKSSKGTKFWQGHVVERDGRFFTCSSAWHTVKDGGFSKKVWSEPYFAEPTNVGRSNERGNEAQAYFDFDSMVQKKVDKRVGQRVLPMLAETYIHKTEPKKSRKDKISFPAVQQPKFDGQCMLYDGNEAWSRGNKVILPEVVAHLQFDTQGYTVHGELLLPTNEKVNKVMTAIKKFQPGLSDTLIYVVYDVVDLTKTYGERYVLLSKLVKESNNPNIRLAETVLVSSEEAVKAQHERNVAAGYEGSIIRNIAGMYQIDKRVDDVQKYKDWEDGEFEIIDIIPAGGGSSALVGKAVCIDDKGDDFESTFTGPLKLRQEYLANKHKYIGKFAKVKYRELSGAKQVPFHSNVLEIRETKKGGY